MIPHLDAKSLNVSYFDTRIIENMDVSIPKGKITSIIGSNGCGKSTLLKALSRTIKHEKGAIYLDGEDIQQLKTIEIAKKMAILPQSPVSPEGLTVRELVAYGRYPHQSGFGRLNQTDKDKINWAINLTDLTQFADNDVDALSGGQRQRVWIAMALAQDTDLVLLDEPTTYLDLAHQIDVLELLKNLNSETGKTIALVIHELNMASRFSDYIIAVKKGKIVSSGTPSEIMSVDILKEVFSIDAHIVPDPLSGRPLCLSYTRT